MIDSETIFNLIKDRVRYSGSNEAIYDYIEKKSYTYKDLDIRSDNLSRFLKKELNLKKGDLIGFCATNSIAFFDAFFSTFKSGIIITTYNCFLHPKELIPMIKNEMPKVIFYSSEFAETIKDIRETGLDLVFICIDDSKPEECYSYLDVMSNTDYEPVEMTQLNFEDIQMLIHTGGTTGQPKAAMISFRALLYNAISDITLFQLSEADSAILSLPLFHTAGWNIFTIPLLLIGGRIILMRRFEPSKALEIIREEKPTVGISVETIYKAMAMHSDFDKTCFSSYRYLISGAAPIGKSLMELYWNKGVKILNAYGMTEIGPNNICPPISSMTIEEVRKKWDSCGIAAPFNQIRIVDCNGNDVPQGKKGELIFRGKLLFSGYWNNPEASNNMNINGWVHTGDVGYIDSDGFYYICGRIKNMFISGGENIYPQEIENVITTLPNVLETCVLGVSDPKWGEVGHALIVPVPGTTLTRDEVILKVKSELASIKIPKYINFVECIPKNAIGKRDLKKIKELCCCIEER